MIGAACYTILMHYRSPLAWLGHRAGWKWLRSVQRYALVWRHYPEHFRTPGLWLVVDGVPDVPNICGRRREYASDAEFAHYLVTTPCWRVRINRFLDWSCPAERLPPFEPDIEMLERAQ